MPVITPGCGGGGAPNGLVVTASLTAAQIRTLHTTPVTLVPAPGAGLVIWPISTLIAYTFVTHPYKTESLLATVWGPLVWDGGSNSFITRGDLANLAASSVLVDSPAETIAALVGTAENEPVTISSTDLFNEGPIATTTLAAGGSGYAPGDTGTINGGNFSDATYAVDTVGAGGAVLTYTVTSVGSGDYSTGTNVGTSVTSGAGNGAFAINIVTVTVGDGTAKVKMLYQVVAV